MLDIITNTIIIITIDTIIAIITVSMVVSCVAFANNFSVESSFDGAINKATLKKVTSNKRKAFLQS